jgi:hypothetical protein
MITFNKPVNEHTSGGGGKEKPTGYFVVKISKSFSSTSKAGNNPMWVIECDICEGKYTEFFKKYPLVWRQVINNEVGEEIASTTIQRIVESNEGMIDPTVITSNTFDESMVNGLIVGAKLEVEKGMNGKDYCKVKNFCSVEYAREHTTDGSF